MSNLTAIKKIICASGTLERAKASQWFFKTGKGQYGYGDVFVGITVPEQRKIAKRFYKILSLTEVAKLLNSKIHEDRFIALEILVMKFESGSEQEQKAVYNLYLKSTKYVNNWDLVDTSASYIVGAYLYDNPRSILKKLAKSKSLWEKRISIIATLYYISKSQFQDTLDISKILIKDEHDLIHKAVGWMLREIGKRDIKTELKFLDEYSTRMPRTMLRYAIERFPETKRQYYLKKK